MSPYASQNNTTPGKRRTMPKSKGKPGSQKAYASENDMSAVEGTTQWQPQTPEKTASPAQNGRGQPNRSNGKNTKPRTDGKKKNNNNNHHQSSSPEPDGLSRPQMITPKRTSSAKGSMPAAFAGATFHASPAPSALPMPSFFVKPSASPGPLPTAEDSDAPTQQLTPPASEKGGPPTPQRQPSNTAISESPLDFIFRAHRQESQRQRDPNAPETPPSQNPQCAPNTFPRAFVQPNHRPPSYRRHSGGIDMEELDGTPGQPVGPAFATPYQDRLKAYQNDNNQYGRTQHQQPSRTHAAGTDDPSEALKKYLFQGRPKDFNYSSPPAPPSYDTISPPPFSACNSFSKASQQRDYRNVQAMENDLRRILKLDVQ